MSPDEFTVDERARQAADGLNDAVRMAELQLFADGIPALRTPEPAAAAGPRFGDRWIAAAGAFAAVVVIVALAVIPGRLFAPDSEVATPETTTATLGETTIVSSPGDGTTLATVATPDTAPPTTAATTVPEGSSSTTIPVDSTPPEITITSPSDGVTVEESLVQFRGTTEPGAHVIAAGRWEADVDAAGNWEIILGLNSGSNIATFTAIDAAGNEATAQVSVVYDPPSPTTTVPEEEPTEVDFSANAVFETCEEDPPFNVYWGTAPPGHKITIGSEYGEGVVYADETGNWEIRVEFPEAPFNVEFPVTVTHIETGDKSVFGFTSLVG